MRLLPDWFTMFKVALEAPNTEINISFRQGRDWLGTPTGRKEVNAIGVYSTNTTRRPAIARWSAAQYSQTQLWAAFNDLIKLSASHPDRIFVTTDSYPFKRAVTPEGRT